ncbi:MAG: elongation factor G [Candidatus Tectomicrobia bacterium]|nr:elongation factor G [Candidatus Tectomicrobia bacterium]
MKVQRVALRNVGLLGDTGSGKTSLAEALLFSAGAIERLGSVLDGTTTMDFDADEQKRSRSLSSALATLSWKKTKINLIDTPGAGNFVADAFACLRVLDAAIFVIHAGSGVRVQTQRLWQACKELGVVRLVYINAMDAERADFDQIMNDLTATIEDNSIIPFHLPLGKGPAFAGVVDVVRQRGLSFQAGGRGEVKPCEVPEALADSLAATRERLTEAVAEADDALLEKYLEAGTLNDDELVESLRAAVRQGSVTPVVCGVATQCLGAQALLDLILDYLPAPNERPPLRGAAPGNGAEVLRQPIDEAPFSALVFKTMADPYSGKLTLFRVMSGILTPDKVVLNANTGEKERLGQLNNLLGKNQLTVTQVSAGDLAVVAKLKSTTTGHTLCDEKEPILYPVIEFPKPVISIAVVPKSKGDEEKVSSGLRRLSEEDLTLQFSVDHESKQLVISGMGEDHLDVVIDRLKRKFGVEVEAEEMQVPYRETIRSSVKVQGRHKKQSGGRGQFGDTWLEIEPRERGSGFEFVDKIVGGAIPRQYIPSVEKGIVEAMKRGSLAGFPVVDLTVTLYDGSYHSVDSSDMAFQIAGSIGFKKGVEQADPVLLEPIVNMEVFVPEDAMGDVIGDLNAKRGKVLGMDSRGKLQVIRAQVPLAEVLKYATVLKSMTGDRGSFSMEFSHYEMLPPHLSEKVIATSKKRGEA